MKLNSNSIEWAINHLKNLGDSDIFSSPLELDIIAQDIANSVSTIADIDISNHTPGSARRFIIPKDDLSYRVATQLDPLDSIILTSIIHQFGALIEQRRRLIPEKRVWSYRFKPDVNGQLYDARYGWNSFWSECYEMSQNHLFATICDISDFYNQIYHHTLENQLTDASLPNQITKWIIKLCENLTAKVSRGIPVGSYASHILAELSLCPIDNSLVIHGMTYRRFIDDIVIFTNSKNEARTAIYLLADILDKQQRLVLQKSKTKIIDRDTFQQYCRDMVENRPINELEKNILEIINRYSQGNPYQNFRLSEVSQEDARKLTSENIIHVLEDYLSKHEIDYIHLRWFIRRLTQISHPGAIDFLISNFESLIPALSEICRYFTSIESNSQQSWGAIGSNLLEILENQVVKSNEYAQISILSLFNKRIELDNTEKLIQKYVNASPNLRREIILAANANKLSDWIRELKEQYSSMDSWNKRAFILACKQLPEEERRFFINGLNLTNDFDKLLANWVKKR